MNIDARIDLARRRQFAGEIEHLPQALVEHLRSRISGCESEEFYAGLLAGLTAATTILQDGMVDVIPQVTCIVANFCEAGELTP